jgi:hypothetical protein
VESSRPRERAKDALAKYAMAVEVAPQPAYDLPSEIAQGVLAYLLVEDHVLDPLPWFEQPSVLDLAVKLPDGPFLFPAKSPRGR